MFPFNNQSIDYGFWAHLVLAGVFCILLFGFIVMGASFVTDEVMNGGARREARQIQKVDALRLWLADCQQPVGVCYGQWDRSHTLRRDYLQRLVEEQR
jgi:hypothetical protein